MHHDKVTQKGDSIVSLMQPANVVFETRWGGM